ncbi:MAG: type II secretion system protein [Phycisphaerales bacterium]
MRRPAFSLVELLVVIAIIAVLVGVLLPVLASARNSARAAACLSNHRQTALALRAYADDHKGFGPALGEPYTTLPNWSLVVQHASGREGSTSAELYTSGSVLVCPSARGFYARDMTRTAAANATGLAGRPADRAAYDNPAAPAHVRFDLVLDPSHTPLVLDSSIAPIEGVAPPATRTASVLDLRDESHLLHRLGRFHGPRIIPPASAPLAPPHADVQFSAFDGSAGAARELPESWRVPLP